MWNSFYIMEVICSLEVRKNSPIEVSRIDMVIASNILTFQFLLY